jgi:DNA-directed RNA polymerase subunit RPC12/RpoP
MGCFNTVFIECPHCGKEIEGQSKSGTCCQEQKDLTSADIEDIIGIANDPLICQRCKTKIVVKLELNIDNYGVQELKDLDLTPIVTIIEQEPQISGPEALQLSKEQKLKEIILMAHDILSLRRNDQDSAQLIRDAMEDAELGFKP